MSSLPPKIAEIMDDLSFFTERDERIQALISLGQKFVAHVPEGADPYPESHKVPGCESEVYAWVGLTISGGLDVKFAVRNPQGISAMALAEVLIQGLQGEKPSLAQDIPESLAIDLFGESLSMGKSLGLTNMIRLVRAEAAKLA